MEECVLNLNLKDALEALKGIKWKFGLGEGGGSPRHWRELRCRGEDF